MKYIPRLKNKYNKEIINNLKSDYKSVMQVPRLLKICLNQGVGSAATDKKQIESAQNEMSIITGQRAVLTRSKKDISNFKLRKGMPVGVMVTLRGDRMYEFLERLITSTIPRIRDFNGIPIKGFDGRGNYTMGIKEQIAFPEISIDKINKVTGMDITFVTDAKSDKEALRLLTELGLPFKKHDEEEKRREEKLRKKQADKSEEVSAVEDKSEEVSAVEDKSEEVSAVEDKSEEVSVIEDKSEEANEKESKVEKGNKEIE